MHLVLESVLIGVFERLRCIAIESTTPENLGYDLLLTESTVIINNYLLGNIAFPKITLAIVYIDIRLLIFKTFICI